jgi:hypothetical protein
MTALSTTKMMRSVRPPKHEPQRHLELWLCIILRFALSAYCSSLQYADFERELLRERTRAGLAQARQNGKRFGRPETAVRHGAEIRKLHRAGISKSEIARRLQFGAHLSAPNPGSEVMTAKRDTVREDRIHNEAIVDAGPDEQALSWYYTWKTTSLSRSRHTTCSFWFAGKTGRWLSLYLN